MHFLFSALLSAATLLVGQGVSESQSSPIQQANHGYQITYPKYTAWVAPNGCLDSLRVGGSEFLAPNVGFRKGSYFYQGGPLETPQVSVEDANHIVAKGDKATVSYAFQTDGMTWTTRNTTASPLVFFLILPTEVKAAIDAGGQIAKTPVVQDWKEVTFVRDHAKLHVLGSDKLWGPFEGATQVWQQDLAPYAEHSIRFEFGTASEAEITRIGKLAAPWIVPESDLMVLSPRAYQVFQRQTSQNGKIVLSGRVRVACEKVEARVTGRSISGPLPGSWRAVTLEPGSRAFRAELTTKAGGWYRVEVRALKAGQEVAKSAVENVGIGEVFVGAGQSNSTNSGQERIQQTSGMVSAFSGTTWQLANDPQPGTHDNSGGGSFWPAFGDAMYARYHVPIGVAVTGHGGTSVNQWQPGGELFQWMLARLYQLGPNGFRAILWHQGESDTGMTSEDYAARMTTVIETSKQLAGWEFPWFVAQVSYHNPREVTFASTRDAQKQLWDTHVALEGPDTDALTGDNRDYNGQGIHFSPKGLRAHGKLWADKVAVFLDRVLNASGK